MDDNKKYTTRALYEVIKNNLLIKDKDLVHFIRTMNDNIKSDFKKIKNNNKITIEEIINRFENYTIVYMMVKGIMHDANISSYQEKTREITDFLLTDELTKNKPEKPQSSIYDADE